MSYPLAAVRRARRRRIVLSLVPLGIAVAIVALAVRYRTEERQTSDYLAVAKELSDVELGLSMTLTELLRSIGQLERPDILTTLQTVAESAEGVTAALEDAVMPRPAARLSGLFTVAVESWQGALGALDEAFITVLDSEDGDESGDMMLARAFEDLRVGDAAYRRFLTSMDDLDPELATRALPAVAFATGDNEPLYDAAAVADQLRRIRKLDENHDVAVTANTQPEPVADSNGVVVLPVADSYDVLVVVTNQGNVAEELIEVSMRLSAPTEDGVEPIELSEVVPFLDPGEATTVAFDGLSLDAGRLYNLRIGAAVADDSDEANSTFELAFLTNEAG